MTVIDELLEIYKTYRPENEVVARRTQILQHLDQTQFAQLEQALLVRNETGDDAQLAIVEDVMSDLLIWTKFDIDTLLAAQLSAGWSPLDYLFRGSGTRTEQFLWERLYATPALCLGGLAWIEAENVTSKFAEWKDDAKSWQALSRENQRKYTHQAGWELNDSAQRRWLFARTCTGLKSDPDGAESLAEPETCLWCQRPMFTTNCAQGEIPNIPFCIYCTNFGAVPMQKQASGKITFSQHAVSDRIIKPSRFELKTTGGNLNLKPASALRDPYSAVDSGRTDNISQIGGFPTWPQAADYPKCVECQSTMPFLMQVESMDFPALVYEGIYQFFQCELCPTEFAVQQKR